MRPACRVIKGGGCRIRGKENEARESKDKQITTRWNPALLLPLPLPLLILWLLIVMKIVIIRTF